MQRAEIHGAKTADALSTKSALWIERREQMHPPPRNGDTGRAADEREEQTLREQLPDESPP